MRYAFAAVLCLLIPAAVQAGLQWYWVVGNLCTAVIIVADQRWIFRPGVSRTESGITCRYIPWYEGNAYLTGGVIPLLGIAMTAAGHEPTNPAWLQFGGILLMGMMPVVLFSVLRMWRRCPLLISPSTLSLRPSKPWSKWIEVQREQIESITPVVAPNPVKGKSLQTEIAYHTIDSGNTDTVVLGLHLTVQPRNLANALLAWNDATDEDPTRLLDRIEQLLRGQSLAI
ncbi:hypothetical protein [Mycolicibacter sinensis]|uniref:hypothetical protein n=1 Tax=Mycolicibacter sinensis (strain JDM601) TaxID=875328 RepID=UPI001F388504|nr:hypothetical protein [Mycolicibacter sinensis]